MKRFITVFISILVLLLVSFLVLGCQQSPQALKAQAQLPEAASSPAADSAQTQKVELNGVIVVVPADWQIQCTPDGQNEIIRLVYTGEKSNCPWIELTPVASNLNTGRFASITPEGASDEVLTFPGAAVNASGAAVSYTYFPSKNVMLTAGYETAEQQAMILNIISSVQYAAP